MRRLFVVIPLWVAGCGGAQAPALSDSPRRSVEYCPSSIPEPIPEEPVLVDWWTDRANACPPGAAIKGMAPPMQKEVWCEKPDGTKYGRWTWWYADGKPLSDGSFNEEGKPDGLWIAWHENGKRKMQGTYVAGSKDGRWTMWHENGEPSTDVRFVQDVKNGKWTWWYESGNKAGEGEFVDEKPNGRWTRCADDGYITKIEIYDHDELVDWIDYDHGRRVTLSE